MTKAEEFTISFTGENHLCLICSAFVFRCGTNVAYKLALTYSHIGVHVRVGALECEVVHICKPISCLLGEGW